MTYVKINPSSTRLGNWLFQYAAAVSENPTDPVSFVIDDEVWMDDPRKYAELWPNVSYLTHVPHGETVRTGLFQDVKYLDSQTVCRFFQCPIRIKEHLHKKYGKVLMSHTVGVSVRRGDYLRLPHRHPFVGETYLRKAVESFPEGSIYVVCSDDISWCKRFFSQKRFSGRRFVFVEDEEVLSQLFIHTMCEHNIISNSSFSWWGAYLNPNPKKRVIFPSKWYGLAIDDDGRSLYWKGCEVIENHYTPLQWMKAHGYVLKNRIGDVLRMVGAK